MVWEFSPGLLFRISAKIDMGKRWVICFVFSCFSFGVNAQEYTAQRILQQAVAAYNIGHFKQVEALLEKERISRWPTEERCQAWRLLALTCLATDRWDHCRIMIQCMLEAEPYYTPSLQDPLRFVQLVKKMQSGNTTLVTASQQEESPAEAPVPVTIITRDMMANIGARTLKEVLLAYVPGMNHVESANEVNIAMRGIFSSGQQKILIMLNGHRLNSRTTNGANPDYSIGLTKVKQIEVLRGPASSLYGNVALTAVVNIITEDQTDGITVEFGMGNWGQRRIDLLVNRRFPDARFKIWGEVFRSDGQLVGVAREQAVTDPYTVEQSSGQAIIGGYKDQPSYDLGFTVNHRKFYFLFNQRYCKPVDPFAAVGKAQGAWYTYGKYPKVNGMKTGYGIRNTQTELAWNGNIASWKINGSIGVDWVIHNQMAVAGDGMRGYEMNGEYTYNNCQVVNWQEYTIGGMVKTAVNYDAGKAGNGNILMGFQFEHTQVYSSDCRLWKDFDILLVGLDVLKTGKENSYSGFTQFKHRWAKQGIVNAGIRADWKIRADGKSIFAVSPRISLIWLPEGPWHFKGSVSRAFVDAPYFFRYNNLPTYKADSLLKPEYLTSVQLSYGCQITGGWYFEGNLFYNLLTDMIYRDKTIMNDSDPYKNAGRMKIAGWEHILRFQGNRWRTNWNMAALLALNRMENVSGKGKVYHIPPLTLTGVVAYCVLKKEKGELWLQMDGKYTTKQSSPIRNIYFGRGPKPQGITDEYGAVTLPDYRLPANYLINGGISGQWKRMFFSGFVYNAFNRVYYQGGSTLLPYRQQGRSLLLKAGIKFK